MYEIGTSVIPSPQRPIWEVIFPNGKPNSQVTIFLRKRTDEISTVYGDNIDHALELRDYCQKNPRAEIKVIPHDLPNPVPLRMSAGRLLKIIGSNYAPLPRH